MPGIRFPPGERQQERLTPMFAELERAFAQQRAELQYSAAGLVPEQVLVIETVGYVQDFIAAVRRTPGMEWLGELDEEDIPPDEFFYYYDRMDKPLGGRLFLVMTNQQAMAQLLSLWRRYQDDPEAAFRRGLNKWKQAFRQLRTIRPWGVEDRLYETGVLDDWQERVSAAQERIACEIELWYRANTEDQQRAQRTVEHLLTEVGGAVVGQALVPEINYHALLAELPIQEVQAVLGGASIGLIRCGQIMFFRAVGQAAVTLPDDDAPAGPAPPELPAPEGEPVVALLDGLPLENHAWLAGRLIVDDPDRWAGDYPAQDRQHGTAMASLIVHGELGAPERPLTRPIYVRPVLKPDLNDWRRPRAERVPENILPVDFVHRAVKRLFEGEGGEPPAAPSVRVINFSVGDPAWPFDRFMSPWARLLDWLAWRYKVLFLVSAGNHANSLVYDMPQADFAGLAPEQLERETIKVLANDARHRRLLSPAEAVNALTVGAIHTDASTVTALGLRKNPFQSVMLPSPVSSLGLGYRRSIKPEILMPGGRQLYRERPTTTPPVILDLSRTTLPPGQQVAAPGSTPGELSATRYACGTSNANALATRVATNLYEVLDALRDEPGGTLLQEEGCEPALLKAMLVHGAKWGQAFDTLERVLRTPDNSRVFKEYAARFLGYGTVDPERVYECTAYRATLLGCGRIGDGDAHVYGVPLPPSLSGNTVKRRLTITLAWLTPMNPAHRLYRRAALWYEPPTALLQLTRKEANWRAVQRGTVQHEILKGDSAVAFVDGDKLEIRISCRAVAGNLNNAVPYGLAVSLEVAEGIGIPVYDEIRERVRVTVPVTAVGRGDRDIGI